MEWPWLAVGIAFVLLAMAGAIAIVDDWLEPPRRPRP